MTAMSAETPDRWTVVDAALRAIKPDIDAMALAACKARIDPDWHRDFYARVDEENDPGYRPGVAAPGASQRRSRKQIQYLHKALKKAVPALRQIKPQAWVWLRLTAYRHGVKLPTDLGDDDDPETPLPDGYSKSLLAQLKALLAAADELSRPPRGRPVTLTLERAVAGVCAAVYFDLRHKCPTTSHPDQRVASVDPYHALVEAVFEEWQLENWENRAKDAAVEWHDIVGS